MDIMSKKERSRRMSLIRSKWTKQEKEMHNYLKGNKIKHEMHPKIIGSPDIFLEEENLAIFMHGCFWHKCPKCYKEPRSRKDYWVAKMNDNVLRDKKNKSILKKQGYNVLIIWEHNVKKSNMENILTKVK